MEACHLFQEGCKRADEPGYTGYYPKTLKKVDAAKKVKPKYQKDEKTATLSCTDAKFLIMHFKVNSTGGIESCSEACLEDDLCRDFTI